MDQKELDAMSKALRSKGLTWSQTSFAVSLVRNAEAAEREQCAKVCLASRSRCRDGADVDFQSGYNAACDEMAHAIRLRPNAALRGKPVDRTE